MKPELPGIIFALTCALGCSDGAEIPTVEVGSAGARLMNGPAKNPLEAYDGAYSQLSRAHYNVRRNLDSYSQNQVGAREAMAQILRSLEPMRSCVPAADRPRFDPYLAKYAGWLKDLEGGTWGGGFLTELERTERELKSKFNPGSTAILVEFPAQKAPAVPPPSPKAPPAADPATPGGLSPDKVEVPVVKAPAPSSSPPSSPAAAPASGTAPVSTRILYKAWDRAHDDLIGAYREKKECRAKYEDVIESLRLLKAQQAGERAIELQIYEYYSDVRRRPAVRRASGEDLRKGHPRRARRGRPGDPQEIQPRERRRDAARLRRPGPAPDPQDLDQRRDELSARLETLRGLKFTSAVPLREGTRRDYAAYVLGNAKRVYGPDLSAAKKASRRWD